jgi:circadian clock protein KaiC
MGQLTRISTGIAGLDKILIGGLIPQRVYLVHGPPGAGKTTLGMHFLAAGASAGERSMMITFGQPEDHVRADASSIALNIEGVHILDLTPTPETFVETQTYDIFSPAEVERESITAQIAKAIRDAKPSRIFVDSFSQLGNLASDAFHHRRLAQSFFRFATEQGATLIVASHERECARDVDGVIHLECVRDRRTIRILKFRGSDFEAGPHVMRLTSSGIEVSSAAA